MTTIDYRTFLEAKAQLATPTGLEIDPAEVHSILKPHQRDTVVWAVRGGRRAIFANFGLGKTLIQLEIVRLILAKLGRGRGLIVLPLGVRQEFTRDAKLLGLTLTFIRSSDTARTDGIYTTNYETVRDGKLDPRDFDVVSLDEAAILRGFGGSKTFREFMRLYEGSSNYRFVATATPSPNEYIELLSYAAFLDVMDVGQAKTRFFKRDSTKADQLTLHSHMEEEFWLWVASWAMFLQTPSDLGHSDEGYVLPPLDVRWHEVPSEAGHDDAYDRHGRGHLFRNAAVGVQEAAREKRDSLAGRVATMRKLVDEAPDDHFLLWHDLEAERHAIAAALPQAVAVWGSQDLEERERRIIDFSDGRHQYLATKPVIAGSGCNFQRHCHRAIFTGIGFKFADFIQAIHRIHRFLQTEPVRIDLIYTEAEREIRASLERKWAAHEELVARMGEIIRTYGLSTIVTDVVRENNQTYRLGWTEQCKDGTKMGAGLPEYLLLFRKPPTDASNGYADVPVVKSKGAYTRHRWQVDAHGFARSNGNRPLMRADFADLPADQIFRLFRDHYLTQVYDFEEHVRAGEVLEARRRLPSGFMLLQTPSWHPDVWTDVARMRTLNMMQERKGQQQHLCPLQFDIVDRVIAQHSMEGETVLDPFAGLMTVPYCALKLGRRAVGIELNPAYFADGVAYVEAVAREASAPTLFDLLEEVGQ